MSPHQTLAVAVRLFAIWLAIYFARTAPAFYRETLRVDDSAGSVGVILVSTLMVVVVLFLWFFPRTVAKGLLDAKSLPAAEPASPDTWFAVGCALIGIWLIVPALASVIYRLSVLYLAQRDTSLDVSEWRFTWIYYFSEIAIGVWLLLGARGARKLFWWARNAEK